MEKKKKKNNKGESGSPLDMVFSWSVKQVLDVDLYKNRVEDIPEEFSSTAHYLNSFKLPLIEETRADYCSGLESIAQAPACELSSISTSKHYKPPKELYFDAFTKPVMELGNDHQEPYKPESGDIIVLTRERPKKLGDVVRPGEPFLIAYVSSSWDDNPCIQMLSSRKINPEQLTSKGGGRLFATYLMNLTTNMRIWRALNPGPKSKNLGLIRRVLQLQHCDSNADAGCSVCLPQDSPFANGLNVSDLIARFDLNESQRKAVLSSISMSICSHQDDNLKLIWGPPGTGKTKTVASLLFALFHLKCWTLTCAPTNIAVLQVAERLVSMVLGSLEHGSYGLGDVVLFGNKKRMKVDDYDDLPRVFLEYRCQVLGECLNPLTGWKNKLESMVLLLKDPHRRYKAYLENARKKDDGGENGGSSKSEKRKGRGKKSGRNCKETIHRLVAENEEENRGKGRKKDQAKKDQAKGLEDTDVETTEEDLMTFEEFVKKGFYSLADRLAYYAENLLAHLPTSCLPLRSAKKMISLVRLLNIFDNLRRDEAVHFHQMLMMKRDEVLGMLKCILESFPGVDYEGTMWDLCLSNACLKFCTASSSIKVQTSVRVLVIDEAAQLKECESAIPLQIPGLRTAIHVGDDRQLPAMVRSKILEDTNFGRSLFQRLGALGKEKHLLNIQYRMHPSISLFPNKSFYEDRIVDATNVKDRIYCRSFLERDMYGPYSFINVAKGKECFRKGPSPRNAEEARVVCEVIANLFKSHCLTRQKISVGVISPYKGQVGLIQERLGKRYEQQKQRGFTVSVRSIDGFQGGEEDVIIISTVRSNGNGSVGFLSNHQRTNVALTRARYCLWIVGSGATLANSDTVWKDLVADAKARGCYHSTEDEGTSRDQGLETARWKVILGDNFKKSMVSLRTEKLEEKVGELLKKLASGWRHQSRSSSRSAICGVASELLQQYKVDDHQLHLLWTVDVITEGSKDTQVIKVWDVLPPSKILKLTKDLDVLFGKFPVDLMNRCKQKRLEGSLVVPMSWPLHPSASSSLVSNPEEGLSGQLAALKLRDNNEGHPSSSFRENVKSKQKIIRSIYRAKEKRSN